MSRSHHHDSLEARRRRQVLQYVALGVMVVVTLALLAAALRWG
ncbi:hypothetical protein [Nocardioides alkalitolerans]|nr:hypothetical protein [Nocardioides alkalitolerans]